MESVPMQPKQGLHLNRIHSFGLDHNALRSIAGAPSIGSHPRPGIQHIAGMHFQRIGAMKSSNRIFADDQLNAFLVGAADAVGGEKGVEAGIGLGDGEEERIVAGGIARWINPAEIDRWLVANSRCS